MSRGGRWRLAMATLRASAAIAIVIAIGWSAWQVTAALRESSNMMPDAAKSTPVKRTELRTATGGVLDEAWLGRTLALPKSVSLMELDLDRLRARLLDDGQVLTASLTRNFPDTLTVHISERMPVARIKVGLDNTETILLVARDGVVFAGTNYQLSMLETLPWLGGFSLTPDGAGYRPIPGMTIIADLLATAQYDAGHVYSTWQIVSLARLEADREIDVTAKDGSLVVFSARSDFFAQLAKLDYMLGYMSERFGDVPRARARIDLSLGREVPVWIEPIAAHDADAKSLVRPALAPGFNVFPSSQSKN